MVLERPRGGTCPGEALGKSLDPATGRTRVLKFLSICHANMGLYQSRLPWFIYFYVFSGIGELKGKSTPQVIPKPEAKVIDVEGLRGGVGAWHVL